MKRVPFVSIGVHLSRPRGRGMEASDPARNDEGEAPTPMPTHRADEGVALASTAAHPLAEAMHHASERHSCTGPGAQSSPLSPYPLARVVDPLDGSRCVPTDAPVGGFPRFQRSVDRDGAPRPPLNSRFIACIDWATARQLSLRPRAPDVDDRLPFRVDSRLRPLRRSPSSPSVAGPCPFLPRRPSRRLPAPRRPMMRSSGGASTHSTPRDRPIGSARSSA